MRADAKAATKGNGEVDMVKKWRARIGWIHPRVNSDIEVYDFYAAAPRDVVLVITHLEVVDSARREEVEASLRLLERAVERLNLSKVDAIMKNGAPVHLHNGVDGHQEILRRLRAATNVPISTSSQALVDALRLLKAKRLLIISSWKRESGHLSSNLVSHLQSEGIGVEKVVSIGRQMQSFEKIQMAPADIFESVAGVAAAEENREADSVYIQSGTLATIEIIEALEQKLGKPVVSSNSVNIWGGFAPLRIRVGPGYGQLLSSI